MGKLFKNLRNSTIPIILVIGLLVLQAMCDLSLPAYMSDIVNVGIQQYGITDITPTEVRQSEMDKMTVFMSDKDKQTVLDNYTKTTHGKYDTYKLKDNLSKDTVQHLDNIFKKPVMIVDAMESDQGKKMVKQYMEQMQKQAEAQAKAAAIAQAK
ncbi:MAG: ABC transporter ATP-binding protein, partial [Bacillota bacterium]|nr:ABC transporter ATP-binding protein [Bacillota bacterium]